MLTKVVYLVEKVRQIAMTGALKNLVIGLGSVVDVFPKSDYGKHVPKQSAEERMRAHWTRTGRHLEKAMNRFAYEQEAEARESSRTD